MEKNKKTSKKKGVTIIKGFVLDPKDPLYKVKVFMFQRGLLSFFMERLNSDTHESALT